MDLLSIIQDRINANTTSPACFTDTVSGQEPDTMHDGFEIEDLNAPFDDRSRVTVHDTYDAFPEKVLSGVRNAYSTFLHSPKVRRGMRPASNLDLSWSPEVQSLVGWFMTLTPPAESFYLEDHLHVLDPVKYFHALRRDIQTGPKGPRARMGTLQTDLYKLRVYLSEERRPHESESLCRGLATQPRYQNGIMVEISNY